MARRELEPIRGNLSTLARIHFHRELRARADPEDVVQQTRLEAHASRDLFRGSTATEQAAWLRGILAANLSNLARDHRRACRDVGRELPLSMVLDRFSRQLLGLAPAEPPSPSSLASQGERVFRIATALAELSPEEQDVILLRFSEDLSMIDIGAPMRQHPDHRPPGAERPRRPAGATGRQSTAVPWRTRRTSQAPPSEASTFSPR
jgi:RNA polymerase sigma-70 factor (ECF subfamily)